MIADALKKFEHRVCRINDIREVSRKLLDEIAFLIIVEIRPFQLKEDGFSRECLGEHPHHANHFGLEPCDPDAHQDIVVPAYRGIEHFGRYFHGSGRFDDHVRLPGIKIIGNVLVRKDIIYIIIYVTYVWNYRTPI